MKWNKTGRFLHETIPSPYCCLVLLPSFLPGLPWRNILRPLFPSSECFQTLPLAVNGRGLSRMHYCFEIFYCLCCNIPPQAWHKWHWQKRGDASKGVRQIPTLRTEEWPMAINWKISAPTWNHSDLYSLGMAPPGDQQWWCTVVSYLPELPSPFQLR